MNVLELLDELDYRGVRVGVRAGPRLHTDAPAGAIDDALAAEIVANRDMLVCIIVGRVDGHAPGACSICGEVSMVSASRSSWPTCRFRSGCITRDGMRLEDPGRHTPRPADLRRVAKGRR